MACGQVAGRGREESDVPRKTGTDRSRIIGGDRSRSRAICASGRVWIIRVYRSRTGLRRGDRYLRDGDDDCEDALEPGLVIHLTRLPLGPWGHQFLFFVLPERRLLLP